MDALIDLASTELPLLLLLVADILVTGTLVTDTLPCKNKSLANECARGVTSIDDAM